MIFVRTVITLERGNAVVCTWRGIPRSTLDKRQAGTRIFSPGGQKFPLLFLIERSRLVNKPTQFSKSAKTKGHWKQCSMRKSELATAPNSTRRLIQKTKCTRQTVEISHKDRHKWTGSTERGGGIHDKIRRSVVDLMDRFVL